MIAEWRASGGKMIPEDLKEDSSDFEGMIVKLENNNKGIGLREG